MEEEIDNELGFLIQEWCVAHVTLGEKPLWRYQQQLLEYLEESAEAEYFPAVKDDDLVDCYSELVIKARKAELRREYQLEQA